MRKRKKILSIQEWQKVAQKRIQRVISCIREFPGLVRLAPHDLWKVEVTLVGSQAMSKLNGEFRKKHYATDVLSFPTQSGFRKLGILGEIVICLPTLKRQAKELGHSPDVELIVLLTHGLLHLLGLDHEDGPVQAARMARWETKILKILMRQHQGRSLGLIDRSTSGIEKK